MNADMLAAVNAMNIEKIQDIWTDMMLNPEIPDATYCEITDALHARGNTELASDLLDMLASHYDAERRFDRAIEICKHLLWYRKEDNAIRQQLINLYRKKHMESEHLNAYLEISGVSTGEPIMKSLKRLDEFLHYDIGRYFYFEKYGIGQVIEAHPDRKEIVLDFERQKRYFVSISVARGLLTPLHKGHFLYLKHTNPSVLQEMAEKEPVTLVVKLLQDWHQPLTGTQIKAFLQGVIPNQQVNKFWEAVRKKLEKDPHVETRGRSNKNYSYAQSIVDRKTQAHVTFNQAPPREKYTLMTEFVASMPDLFNELVPSMGMLGNRVYKKDPALAIDIFLFCNEHDISGDFAYTVRSLLEENEPTHLLKKISDPVHQKKVLDCIKEMNPGTWTKLFKNIMLTGNQMKVLDEIYSALQEHQNVMKDTFYTILSMPKNYPYAFRWVLKKIIDNELADYDKAAFLPRIIESMDHITGIRSLVMTLLSLERFDRVIKRAALGEAQRILDTILTSESLEEYQKNDLTRIIEYHHASLVQQEKEIIYTTAQALAKRQAELEHMLSEEIPANKKEISRAREFGDLSENFEYKAAREKQAQLLEKVRTMEQEIAKAEIIDPAKVQVDSVSVGTKVILKDSSGQSNHYTILGRWDTDLDNHIISNEAPAAQHLLGKKIGDTVIIQDVSYAIERIEKAL